MNPQELPIASQETHYEQEISVQSKYFFFELYIIAYHRNSKSGRPRATLLTWGKFLCAGGKDF